MQVFAYKMCNFLKKVFQCPPSKGDFSIFSMILVLISLLTEEWVVRLSVPGPAVTAALSV